MAGCSTVGSARLLGSRGRRFKSCHPDHFFNSLLTGICQQRSSGLGAVVARTHGVREARSSNLLAPTKKLVVMVGVECLVRLCYVYLMKKQYRVIVKTRPEDSPYDFEMSAALLVANFLKSDVEFLRPQHLKTPDLMIRGVIWELKSPTGGSKNTILIILKTQENNLLILLLILGVVNYIRVRRYRISNLLIKNDNEITVHILLLKRAEKCLTSQISYSTIGL